jgi:hypothetical protein
VIVYKFYRGSDRTIPFRLKDAGGGSVDLTGATVEIYQPHPALAGHIAAAITMPAAGSGEIAISWDEAMPHGREMMFRLRFTIEGKRLSGPQVWLEVE